MKKTDVYVVVDTPKKARKLKNVLGMFREDVHRDCVCHDDGYPYYTSYDDIDCWAGNSSKDGEDLKNKTEVSIKELRNILAKEHLKAGDVVALGYGKSVEYIGVFKALDKGHFEVDRYLSLNSGSGIIMNGPGYIKNFLRYATEEEKALLEPKKELEVGKWYKTEKSLFNHQDGYGSYGFFNKKWKSGDWKTYLDDFALVTPVEATEYEVKSTLVEEAKKRGYKDGDIIRSLFSGMSNTIRGNEYDYSPSENILAINGNWVFRNGQWAEIIEKGAFDRSDIAIVELLHDILHDNHGYSLESKLLMDARMLASKIKSKIKKRKDE